MTNLKNSLSTVVDGEKRGWLSRKSKWVPLAIAGGLGALGFGIYGINAAAISLNSGNIDLTVGVSDVANCGDGTVISINQSVNAQGESIVQSIDLSGIPASCDNRFIALVLSDNGGNLLDEIVWELELQAGDTSITARVDGSTVATSNTSDGSVSVSYPTSQTDPEGLEAGLLASDVVGANVIDLESQRAARAATP
jgi:hypothetical protein